MPVDSLAGRPIAVVFLEFLGWCFRVGRSIVS